MNRNLKIIAQVLIFLLTVTGVFAQSGFKRTAQTAMKWLSIPVGAQGMALGTANYLHHGDAGDIYWNPSGVAYIESPQLFISYMPWIADVTQEALAFAYPVRNMGVFTASVRYIDYGTLVGTQFVDGEETFEYTGDFVPTSMQIGLGFAQRVSDRFCYGLNLSYVTENLGDVYTAPIGSSRSEADVKSTSLSLLNFDFGILYYAGFKDLRVGMTLRNFAQEKGYGNVGNSLPMDLRIGVAMDILSLLASSDQFDHKLTLSCDVSHPRDYSERIQLGVAYSLKNFIDLRTGYKFNYDEENVSFGFGLRPTTGFGSFKIKSLDYAYLPFDVFNSVQSMSITLGF